MVSSGPGAVALHRCEADRPPFADAERDAIYCISVLQDIPSYETLLLEPMKILIIAPAELGFVPRPMMLGQLLAAEGHQVEIHAPHLSCGQEAKQVTLVQLPLSNTCFPRKIQALGGWLSALRILRSNADVCIGFDSAIAACLIAKCCKPSIKVIAYHLEYFEPRPGAAGLWIRFIQRFEQKADLVIDVNEARLERRKKWTSPIRQQLVLPNDGLPGAFIQASHISHKPIRFLFIGGTWSANSLHLLLECLCSSPQPVMVDLFCTGEANVIMKLKSAFDDNIGARTVRFCEPVSRVELERLLARYDVGIVWYPFQDKKGDERIAYEYCAPNKLGEYLAAGLAILASDNPSLRFVQEKEIGIQCNPFDKTSIQRAIALLSDEATVERFKTNARQVFATERNYAIQAKPLLELLQSWTSPAAST